MKIFQLIHWLTKLFKLNNRSKIILLILLPLPIFSQNNAAFWLGKRAAGAAPGLPIITENLIAYYDASNTDSYPRNGTTWFDLSGNDYHLTISGATYLSDDGGIFDFDGVNDYALYNTGDIAQDLYTIQLWLKADNLFGPGTRQFVFHSDASASTIYTSELQIGAVYNGFSQVTMVSGYPGVAAYGNDIRTGAGAAGTWYNIAVVFSSAANGFDFYVNGVKIADNQIANGTGRLTRVKNILLGTRNTAGTLLFNGKLGEIYFYSSLLTDSEILANFNATKTRFGL